MLIARRTMLLSSFVALAAGRSYAEASCGVKPAEDLPEGLLRPGEQGPHAATWMAYGATARAWGDSTDTAFDRDLTNSRIVARQDLMRLAANLSRFEPVFMLVSDAADESEARQFLDDVVAGRSPKDQFSDTLDGSGRIYIGKSRKPEDLPPIGSHPITFLIAPLDDLWTRDTAPIFALAPDGSLLAVIANFNGWGQWPISTGLCNWTKDPKKTENGVLDQFIENDRLTAAFIADHLQAQEIKTWLTFEGGGLETNGHGLGLAMASSIINDNRNPGKSAEEIDTELGRVFGIKRMLWMPGVYGEELTDWHIDFTARFAAPDKIAFAFDRNWEPEDNRNELALLTAVEAVNALPTEEKSRLLGGASGDLTLHSLPTPRIEQVYAAYAARNTEHVITERTLEEFILTTAPGYVGYAHANGAIILGQFGDAENDLLAFQAIQALYPDNVVVQISTDGLASGGGTIHCATQEQPAT